MFTSTVRATLIALVATALSASAAPSLSLQVSSPKSIDGVENLKVVTKLVNTGDETLKLLNDPRGPLNKLPTHTFEVVNAKTGATPKFDGIKVKYLLETAAKIGTVEDFTILAPGESIAITHNLGEAYDFTSSGAGAYSIAPTNLFHYVDASGAPVEIRASLSDAAVASVQGKLAVVRPTPELSRRATYRSCTSARQTLLVAAASQAQSYATNAYNYISGISSGTTRYTTWFGTYDASRKSTVQSHFSLIRGNTFSSYTYDCSCTSSAYAYVYPGTFGVVYLCNAFWNAPVAGTDSRGGTLIHESSHFTANGGTQDIVYGQSGAKSLAQSNPANAVRNADSHEYFAENTPSQS